MPLILNKIFLYINMLSNTKNNTKDRFCDFVVKNMTKNQAWSIKIHQRNLRTAKRYFGDNKTPNCFAE